MSCDWTLVGMEVTNLPLMPQVQGIYTMAPRQIVKLDLNTTAVVVEWKCSSECRAQYAQLEIVRRRHGFGSIPVGFRSLRFTWESKGGGLIFCISFCLKLPLAVCSFLSRFSFRLAGWK